MKNVSIFAAVASTIMLIACGVQTSSPDDLFGTPPTTDPGIEFGGVGDSGSNASDSAAPCTSDGGSPVADSGGGTTDSGSSQSDAGSTVVDSGSPVVDSGVTDSGAADSGSDAMSCDAGVTPDSGTDSGTDAGVKDSGVVVPDNADVVRLSADHKTFQLSTRYIFSVNCGEVRGPMPGVGWSSGPQSCDSDNDGYFNYTPIAGTVGTYAFSYLDPNKPADGWALYGNIDLLRAMSPTARSFVECNWWNASTQQTVSVGSPSCSLKATFGANGLLAGAGNMANLL